MDPTGGELVLHITDSEGLADLCERLRHGEWIGMDTEFIRERTYYPQLCLIQVSGPGVLATVDPLADLDLSPLDALLVDTSITKVLHASRQDFEVLSQARGLIPGPVFDTQIAAALAGYGDQPGYAKLVEAMLGVALAKGHTRTDWSQRPLAPAQIDYAIDDVRYLGEVHHRLREQLVSKDRLGWLREDFAALADPGLYKVEPEDAWRKVKGAGRLRKDRQGALRALAAWRERAAQTADRPRGWIIKDDLLVELVHARPSDAAALAAIRGLGDGLLRRSSDEILACLAQGAPADAAPTPAPLSATEDDLLNLLQVATRLRARELGVSPQSLATRRDLTAKLRGEAGGGLDQGWRRAALGELLDDVIAGRRIVRNGPSGPELVRAD